MDSIYTNMLTKYGRHGIPMLARQNNVSEKLVERVLAIRSSNSYCIYRTYFDVMRDIYNVYINYLEGKESIAGIIDMLEYYKSEYRYLEYKFSKQKLCMSLGLDKYELLLLDNDYEYEFDSNYTDGNAILFTKTLRDFKFLCSGMIFHRKGTMELFEELVNNQINVNGPHYDVHILKQMYSDILSKRNIIGDLFTEQAELNYILYSDLITELDFASAKTNGLVSINNIKSYRWNDMDESLIRLGSKYLYKIIDGVEIPIWYINKGE